MVKSNYDLITKAKAYPKKQLWKAIWKWKPTKKVKTFPWLLVNDKLFTNVNLVSKKMSTCAYCLRCGAELKTSLYAIRDYTYVRDVRLRHLNPKY